MARDYKRTNKRKRRSSSGQRNSWLWLSGGLIAGAIIGYLGYLVQAQSGLPAASQETRSGAPTTASTAAPAPTPKATAKPAAKPAAPPPAEPAPAKNRFEFYTLLPEMEMQVGEEQFGAAPDAKAPKKNDSGPYILQVGSFRQMEEADSLKARLALLGIESTIQTVVIRDQDIWYRVRVGPYDSLRAMGQMRSLLQRNDIDFMVLRLGA